MKFYPGELILLSLTRIGEWHENLSEHTGNLYQVRACKQVLTQDRFSSTIGKVDVLSGSMGGGAMPPHSVIGKKHSELFSVIFGTTTIT